jgi:ribosomal protein S12 methylthiotransferase accessory factor
VLRDSLKGSGADYDKVRSPDETLEWVRRRFQDLGGAILHSVERIDKGRLGIPVYMSKYTAEACRLTGTFKQMGKGVTPSQAEASAVMELVERFSLFSFVREREHRICRAGDIGEDVVPQRDMLKALHFRDSAPDSRLRARELTGILPLRWVKAYRPLDNSWCWLPWSWFWPLNEYNGSAAGNSLEEAAVQALCEVVERHVCSLVTYDRLSTPTIDLDSIGGPVARGLLDRFRRLGIEVVLKDFTLGLGIPTVGAIAWDPSTFPARSEIVYTAGTATHPERAIVRALTEVAQLAGDFDTEGRYVESGLPLFADLEAASYVLETPSYVSVDSMPACDSENFRVELENACRILDRAGMNVYLVDVTHPDVGVPVAYVVIPGNHFRDRTRGLHVAFHAARLASSFEDTAQALSLLKAIDDLYSQRFDVAFYTGNVLEQCGEYREALDWYERALQLEPDPGEVASIYCHRGLCHKEMENFSAAVEELKRSRSMNPGLKETHNLLGYCFFRLGEHLRAIESFEQAIAIDPGSAIDYANIGSNLRQLGMNDAAAKWYEMALELDPDLEWAREHLNGLGTRVFHE